MDLHDLAVGIDEDRRWHAGDPQRLLHRGVWIERLSESQSEFFDQFGCVRAGVTNIDANDVHTVDSTGDIVEGRKLGSTRSAPRCPQVQGSGLTGLLQVEGASSQQLQVSFGQGLVLAGCCATRRS